MSHYRDYVEISDDEQDEKKMSESKGDEEEEEQEEIRVKPEFPDEADESAEVENNAADEVMRDKKHEYNNATIDKQYLPRNMVWYDSKKPVPIEKKVLRPWQAQAVYDGDPAHPLPKGVNSMVTICKKYGRMCDYSPMGTGKTPMKVELAKELFRRYKPNEGAKLLVIGPKSVTADWIDTVRGQGDIDPATGKPTKTSPTLVYGTTLTFDAIRGPAVTKKYVNSQFMDLYVKEKRGKHFSIRDDVDPITKRQLEAMWEGDSFEMVVKKRLPAWAPDSEKILDRSDRITVTWNSTTKSLEYEPKRVVVKYKATSKWTQMTTKGVVLVVDESQAIKNTESLCTMAIAALSENFCSSDSATSIKAAGNYYATRGNKEGGTPFCSCLVVNSASDMDSEDQYPNKLILLGLLSGTNWYEGQGVKKQDDSYRLPLVPTQHLTNMMQKVKTLSDAESQRVTDEELDKVYTILAEVNENDDLSLQDKFYHFCYQVYTQIVKDILTWKVSNPEQEEINKLANVALGLYNFNMPAELERYNAAFEPTLLQKQTELEQQRRKALKLPKETKEEYEERKKLFFESCTCPNKATCEHAMSKLKPQERLENSLVPILIRLSINAYQKNRHGKVLIFYHFNSTMIKLLDYFLSQEWFKGRTLWIHGQTSPEHRATYINKYNEPNDDCCLMLVQLKVGGSGISLEDRYEGKDKHFNRFHLIPLNDYFIESLQSSGRTIRIKMKSESFVRYVGGPLPRESGKLYLHKQAQQIMNIMTRSKIAFSLVDKNEDVSKTAIALHKIPIEGFSRVVNGQVLQEVFSDRKHLFKVDDYTKTFFDPTKKEEEAARKLHNSMIAQQIREERAEAKVASKLAASIQNVQNKRKLVDILSDADQEALLQALLDAKRAKETASLATGARFNDNFSRMSISRSGI
jgi:hypothetical protein